MFGKFFNVVLFRKIMKLKKKYKIASIFFLFLSILVVTKNVSINNYELFFWLCDLFPVLFLIGFLLSDEQLVKGLINVGFISQILSFISLFSAVFLGINIVGFENILNYNWIYITSSFILHLLSVNVALLFVYKTKPKIKSLVYSFIILLGILILSLLFASPDKNVNYVYNMDFLGVSFPYYTYFYAIYGLIILVLPTYFMQYLLYKIYNKNTKFNK